MGKRILIVDDDLESVRLTGLLLERRGYEIIAAQSGAQALKKARDADPDLVILDIMMPGIDGYEVCQRLRADPATANLPVIMFTAKTHVDDKVLGFEVGADDYLTKPVHADELASRVEAVLLRSRRIRTGEEPAIRAKILGFLGSKGGVGTTTLAVNSAVALAQQLGEDEQIVLADLQSGMATSALQLGLRRHGGLARLLDQQPEDIEASLVQAQLEEHETGVLVLSGQSEPPGAAMRLSPAFAEAIVRHLEARAAYVLLDLGVGLDQTNRLLLPLCSRVLVTVEPNRVALMLAKALLDEIIASPELGGRNVGVVLMNKTRASAFSTDAVEDLLQHDLAGVVTPAPELAFRSTEEGIPMVMIRPDSVVAQQFRTIAEHLAKA